MYLHYSISLVGGSVTLYRYVDIVDCGRAERGEKRPGVEARLEKYPLPTVYDVCASPVRTAASWRWKESSIIHFSQ